MLKLNPFSSGDSLTSKENYQRLGFLSECEIEALLAECQPYLHEIVEAQHYIAVAARVNC
jgi:hypothetical protein